MRSHESCEDGGGAVMYVLTYSHVHTYQYSIAWGAPATCTCTADGVRYEVLWTSLMFVYSIRSCASISVQITGTRLVQPANSYPKLFSLILHLGQQFIPRSESPQAR